MTVLMPLKDQSAAKLSQNNLAAEGGHYLLGANRHWHGGMHFTLNSPVQAIADGKLIAYRLGKDYLTADLRHSGSNPDNKYSNSFALIQHESKIKGRTLNYYSLYMHLMPASGYNAKPNMAIPDFIRAMEGSDKDAVIQVKEKQIDIPGGLRIRELKTGEIVTVAPVGSEISLDNNSYTEAELTRYTENAARNASFKKVTFIDHKEKAHNGYALLDDDRVKQEGDNYTIITQEDPLKSGDANALKGLKLRSEKNYDDDTVIKVLKNATKVKIKIVDTQWAEVKEIDGTAPDGDAYLYYKDRIKFDENDIDEDLLDSVHCPNQVIKSGDLLGNPGLNFSQRNSLHFEIFTDDSIIEFIKDHENLDLSDKTILQVNKGSHLFQRKKIDVPKAIASIDKHSRIKIEDDDASSEYVKITATDTCGVVKRTDMEGYNSSSNQYKGIKANLDKYQSKISADLAEGSRLEFIYYSNGAGDLKTADTHDGHRLVAFPIAESAQKTYWVKRDLINSQNITTDDVTKGTILFNSLNSLFPENPIKFTFQEVFSPGSSDEALVDLVTTNSCQDSDGETWYEVKLPFDDKGDLHYLGVLLGVNRTAQEKGWVKASDTELTTALNWPGFKIAKETGEGSQDAKIDFKNLTPFFKELFEDIDTSGDGSISAKEMKAALKDSVLADRLSRVIAKHPSEWQTDPGLSKWQYLEKLVPDAAAFEEAKTQIKNLAWWDDAQCAGADLPMSPEVYHLHPVAFINNLMSFDTLLESLMLLDRLTPSEIKTARELIYRLEKSKRADYYLKLQRKVKYRNQRNNNQASSVADRMCNLTSLAMAFEYLGAESPEKTVQFEDYLERKRIEDNPEVSRIQSSSWATLAADFNINMEIIALGTDKKSIIVEKLKPYIMAGSSIILSAFSIASGQGHIVRIQELTGNGIIVDDPFGRINDFSKRESGGSGYAGTANSRKTEGGLGEDNLWTWSNIKETTLKYACVFSETEDLNI